MFAMNHSSRRPRNACRMDTRINVVSLFVMMAYDLKVQEHPLVQKAANELRNKHYVTFLNTLDEMTSQMYTSVDSTEFRLHQLAAFLSKYPFEDPAIDRRETAMRKFLKSEHRCKRMNQKLRARRSRVEPPHMQYMRDFIAKTIGFEPDYAAIFRRCDFGPGSSIGVHGAQTDFVSKLRRMSVTPSCLPVARAALMNNTHYCAILAGGGVFCLEPENPVLDANLSGQQVWYNKIVCVPKNAKTDRTIAIEPSLNGFVQKGIDLTLRQCLFRIGIDLSRQSLNQALARLGSIGRGYATIDLSAASDSVSIELVRDLLPPAWFSLLNSVRSPSYITETSSELVWYHKFCSMGNGFCFPLETLLFAAASSYAMSRCLLPMESTYSVYGDDIIVPQGAALLLLEVLRDLGFTPNNDKTFVVGDFKESCGADFFAGTNVRPIYLKSELHADYRAYPLMNALRKRKLSRTWQVIFDHLKGRWRALRPYSRDDDTAIDVDMDTFMTSQFAEWNRKTHSWNWRRYVAVTARGRKVSDDQELLAGKLRGDLADATTFAARFSERAVIQVGT